MRVMFFVFAIFWAGCAWYDYSAYGANHYFWIDIFMIFFSIFFAILTFENKIMTEQTQDNDQYADDEYGYWE